MADASIGVTRGSRPLVAVESTPQAMLPALRAAWTGGPAVLPLDASLPPKVRSRLLLATTPGAIARPDGLVSLPGGTPVADDTVVVVPTSGSTGPPKGVELGRGALEASVRSGLARTGADPAVPWLCCLPVSHVAGILVLLRAIVTGTPPIVHDGFDAGAVAAVAGPVHLATVPTMLRRLLDAGARPERWASVLVGGARLPAGLREQVPSLTATYGMTETSGGCVYDGRPLDGVRVAADDLGRLRIGGPTLMLGYRGAPTSGLDADGWFTSNDLGRVEADGTVVVLGRADDVIVTGGENVLASQVEARLEAHPAVAEAVVVGVPDPEWGQRLVAVVVPEQVGAVLSLALLRSFVAESMPRHAAPQAVQVVNALPRLRGGKIDRVAVQRAAQRG